MRLYSIPCGTGGLILADVCGFFSRFPRTCVGLNTLFFDRTKPCSLFLVFYPEQERSMAGFGVRKDHKVTIQTDCDGRQADHINVKDLEARLDVDIFLEIAPDELPGLLEAGVPQDDLVIHGFYTAHGATSSSAFLSGRGLCTAFAAIVIQGKSIFFTCSS
jgi:hypothetical protein